MTDAVCRHHEKVVRSENSSEAVFFRPKVTCLGVPDTRRFVAFIENAYSGNWQVMNLLEAEANNVNFRDFDDAEYSHRAARKMRGVGSPSVFRTYS